jgi:hypothetical protein
MVPATVLIAVRSRLEAVPKKRISMKKVTFLTVAIAMIAAFSVRAADDAKAKRPKPTAEEIKKYDKNGDGKLDKDERKAWADDKKKEAK